MTGAPGDEAAAGERLGATTAAAADDLDALSLAAAAASRSGVGGLLGSTSLLEIEPGSGGAATGPGAAEAASVAAAGPAAAAPQRPPDDLPRIVAEHWPALGRLLGYHRIPVEDAEDLVQTTMMKALHQWSEIRDPIAWLLGALRLRCLQYRRDRWRSRQRQVELDAAAEGAGGADAILLRAPGVPPVSALPPEARQVEMRHDLQRLSRGLPARYRVLIAARYQLGMVDHEVAEATGFAPGSVRKLTLRGVERMREEAERAGARVLGGGATGKTTQEQ